MLFPKPGHKGSTVSCKSNNEFRFQSKANLQFNMTLIVAKVTNVLVFYYGWFICIKSETRAECLRDVEMKMTEKLSGVRKITMRYHGHYEIFND